MTTRSLRRARTLFEPANAQKLMGDGLALIALAQLADSHQCVDAGVDHIAVTATQEPLQMPGKLPCRIVDAALQADDVNITASLVGHLTTMNAPRCYFRASPNPQAFDQ